jgi:outer membrane protein assembly factor BamA
MIPEHHESTSTATSNNWGVLPEAGYSPDQKLNGGFKFTGRQLTSYDLTVDGEVNAAMGKQTGVDAAFLAPHMFARKAINLDEYHYYKSPDKDFFGLGNNHVSTPSSVYLIERRRGLLTFAYHLSDDFVAALSAGLRSTRIADSPGATDSTPSTTQAFPQLVGIHGGHTNPLVFSFIYNNRESITRPTRGWSVIGAAEHVNQNLDNDFHFTRFTLDAGYLHPFISKEQVIGVHFAGETIAGRDRYVPFFELASLGGSTDMRGFFPDRFLGRSRIVANTEYRRKLVEFTFMKMWDVQIDGVAFFDVGRVFISGAEEQHEFRVNTSLPGLVDEFRYSYGPGLRIELGEAIVARLDAGFSNEQTGLVYLVFGHTF